MDEPRPGPPAGDSAQIMSRPRRRAVSGGARPGPKPRFSGEDMVVITRLHAKGRSVRTIARLISTPERSVHPSTVARWIRRVKQPQEELHQALASMRMDAVQSWHSAMKTGAKYGRHAPAKDLLIATGTIQPDATTDRLVIIVGDGTPRTDLPQPPRLETPTVDAVILPTLPRHES